MASTTAASLEALTREITACRACPRLVEWREAVAASPRAAFRAEHYWGKPLPGFGDPHARLLVAGLAPAAHGGNRTGRVFTGDRSGDFLFAALHRAGYANQATSTDRGDGLALRDAFITAAVRCAPPANRPTPAERDECKPYLVRELQLLSRLGVVVALGGFAYQALWASLDAAGWRLPTPRPPFGHGREVEITADHRSTIAVIGCYHPSQQNTFTGRLTPAMLDDVFARARVILDQPLSDETLGRPNA
jgi:uracil-DNA glycosylase family 4